jgi:hypothetical protein
MIKFGYKWLWMIAVSIVLSSQVYSTTTVKVFENINDTYVRYNYAQTINFCQANISIGANYSEFPIWGYFKIVDFDLSLPYKAELKNLTFCIYKYGISGGADAQYLKAFQIYNHSYDLCNITGNDNPCNNNPTSCNQTEDWTTQIGANNYHCWDLTALAKREIINGSSNIDFMIQDNATDGSVVFLYSSENPILKPYYNLTYLTLQEVLTGNAISYTSCNGDILEKYFFVGIDGEYKNVTIPKYCPYGCSEDSCNPNPIYSYLFILITAVIVSIVLWRLFS